MFDNLSFSLCRHRLHNRLELSPELQWIFSDFQESLVIHNSAADVGVLTPARTAAFVAVMAASSCWSKRGGPWRSGRGDNSSRNATPQSCGARGWRWVAERLGIAQQLCHEHAGLPGGSCCAVGEGQPSPRPFGYVENCGRCAQANAAPVELPQKIVAALCMVACYACALMKRMQRERFDEGKRVFVSPLTPEALNPKP